VYLDAHTSTAWRTHLLACSIANLLRNVAPTTPLDIYVFVLAPKLSSVQRTLDLSLGRHASRVCLIPIASWQWQYQLPRATPYQLPNNTNRYSDYLVMGQWRLLVPFTFATALGYPYVLQLDDDLFVHRPFRINMVEHMRDHGQLLANHRVYPENRQVGGEQTPIGE
jgi:hypothetical protein